MKRDISHATRPAPHERRFDRQSILATELHVRSHEHDSASLARALGVSIATVGRLLAVLRRRLAEQGGDLVSVKRGTRSHYEIEDDVARGRRWAALRRWVGVVEGRPRAAGETIDDVLYGSPRP